MYHTMVRIRVCDMVKVSGRIRVRIIVRIFNISITCCHLANVIIYMAAVCLSIAFGINHSRGSV